MWVRRSLVAVTVMGVGFAASMVGAPAAWANSQPVVTSLNPVEGPKAGGNTLMVHGSWDTVGRVTFEGAKGIVQVQQFNGSPTPTDISLIVPAPPSGAAFPYQVHVVVYDNNPNVPPSVQGPGSAYTYMGLPTVSSLTPNRGLVNGGLSVTIMGTGFAASSTVMFGSVPATSVQFVSDTKLTVVTPYHALGTVSVKVTNPGGDAFGSFRFQNGHVMGWGSPNPNFTGGASNVPLAVPALATSSVRAVADGGDHRLALLRDGTVVAWGHNYHGQIGDPSLSLIPPALVTVPVTVRTFTADPAHPGQTLPLSKVTAIAATTGCSLALDKTGTVWAWGNSCGLGGYMPAATPFPTFPDGYPVKAIAAGGDSDFSYAYALDTNGSVWAWGDNSSGQLGYDDGGFGFSTTPQRVTTGTGVPFGLPNVTAMSAGDGCGLALDGHHVLWYWGTRCGYWNPSSGNTRAEQLPFPPSVQLRALVAAKDENGYALDSTGSVWAWGDNFYGQLGNGSSGSLDHGSPPPSPTKVPGLIHVKAISAGAGHVVALKGRIPFSWGANYFGQLGDGTNTQQSSPVKSLLTRVKFISANWGSTFAIVY
jgi:alpha-tubulin suppressor-like RCC1 family protein